MDESIKQEPTVGNHSYGSHPAQVFDLWLAKSAASLPPKKGETQRGSPKPTPLLLYIHGGGFYGGKKEDINPALLCACLEAGITVAAIEYRLSGVAPYPAQMLDCARALQYLRANAKKWNIDPKRVASTGGSAGAGISQWLAYHKDLADPKSKDPVARQSTRLRCAVPTSAQCSYDPREVRKIVPGNAYDCGALKRLHGLPETYNWDKDPIDEKLSVALKDCSPITHLTKDAPPIMYFNNKANEKDGDIHHPNFGRHLKAAMDKLGLQCELHLDTDFPEKNQMVDAIVAFLKRHLFA